MKATRALAFTKHFRRLIVVGVMFVASVSYVPAGGPNPGHDVIVGDLNGSGPHEWGGVDGLAAYSIGPTACNIGTLNIPEQFNTVLHRLTPQNIYRLKEGRFEQIGMSWGMHGFCDLQGNLCFTACPNAGGCLSFLAPLCSSPHTASRGGATSLLGPRWEVNAWTGVFAWPYSSPDLATPEIIGGRIQVHSDDLNPALNPGATFFGEVTLVHLNDAADLNHYNNESYRQIVVQSQGSGGTWNLNWTGLTVRERPAIYAWQTSDADVAIDIVDVPDEGRFLVGCKVSELQDGFWYYEYAVYNMNSDRSMGSFAIEHPQGETLLSTGFHDVDYHSGDGIGGITIDGTDWSVDTAGDQILWHTQSFAVDPNANALRWNTLYNFRFVSTGPPIRTDATIGLFKPGTPDQVLVNAIAPGVDCDDNSVADSIEIAESPDLDLDANGILDVCQEATPFVSPVGARYLEIQIIGGDPAPVAVLLTGDGTDPRVSCVSGYVQEDGTLAADAFFQTSAEWTLSPEILDAALVPSATYSLKVDTGVPGFPSLGSPVEVTTLLWGDVDGNSVANLIDARTIVRSFQGLEPDIPTGALDMAPCEQNGVINLVDALWDVRAFQGETYTDRGCPLPCGE